MSLPPLREELALLPGPVLADGQPSWTMHDPVRNLFFQIDWPTFEVLRRWWMDDAHAIAAAIDRETTLRLDTDDVQRVAQFLAGHQLLRRAGVSSARQMADRVRQTRSNPWTWLLHHYLFFRIPLWRPNDWLARWLPWAMLFASRRFLCLTLGALAIGLTQVAAQWDRFSTTLVDTFTVRGIAAYGVALVAVKLLHELGHAFTAKRHGCRVPAMGVAFLVMWPVAYTDTNDAWRLTDRRRRLHIACAGIATELAIAAWATLAWALLPDGYLRSAAFVLATTSWVATLAINASPFMRFDGYFILSDWLDFPNLHERSFAMARWRLRELLFGLQEDPPEHFNPRATRFLVAFAWAVWLYRLVLFIGIALLVYHYFFKLLGVILFMVEIAWFIGSPIKKELTEWRKRWREIARQRRWRGTGAFLVTAFGLLAAPWPTGITATGLLRPTEVWPLHAPSAARVETLRVREGQRVQAGATLVTLQVPELDLRQQATLARVEHLRWQAASAGLDEPSRARILVGEQALATTQAELASIYAEQQNTVLHAPYAGVVRDLDPELHVGQWVAKTEKLAVLLREGTPWVVETWLDEDQIKRVRPGDTAMFVPEGGVAQVIKLRVSSIERDASRTVSRRELATVAGGHIVTREKTGQLIPEQAIYRVTLDTDSAGGELAQRGHITIHGRWESPLAGYLRHAMAVGVRELGF